MSKLSPEVLAERVADLLARQRFGEGVDMAGRHLPHAGEMDIARRFVRDELSGLTMLQDAAVDWWIDQRPDGMTLDRHLEIPTAGCETAHEELLAVSVADLIRTCIAREASAGG